MNAGIKRRLTKLEMAREEVEEVQQIQYLTLDEYERLDAAGKINHKPTGYICYIVENRHEERKE